MKPVTIRKTIEIAAPPAQVWRYIGTAAGLQKWWGVKVAMEERVGGRFEEQGEQAGQPYRKSGEVTTYDPPHQLAIRLYDGADDRWPTHTELAISLTGSATVTTVEVVHRAFAETAAVATDATSFAQQTAPTAYGPTMALPGYAGTALVSTVPLLIQSIPHSPLTLQALYGWRHGQEQAWQQRFASLATVVIHVQLENA